MHSLHIKKYAFFSTQKKSNLEKKIVELPNIKNYRIIFPKFLLKQCTRCTTIQTFRTEENMKVPSVFYLWPNYSTYIIVICCDFPHTHNQTKKTVACFHFCYIFHRPEPSLQNLIHQPGSVSFERPRTKIIWFTGCLRYLTEVICVLVHPAYLQAMCFQ